MFGASNVWLGLPCTFWPAPADGKAAPVHAAGAPPILVVGTTDDPATPYASARALTRELRSARLLTYVGEGHTAYGRGDACIDGKVDTYLLSRRLPRAGHAANSAMHRASQTRSSDSILIVAAHDLVDDVVGEMAHESSRDLLRVGPGRVGVRVVGLEGDVVDADAVERLEPVAVVEEAAVDLAVVVGRRRVRHEVLHAAPRAVLAPHVVGPFEHVRQPADLAFGVRELQRREAHEHAREQEVGSTPSRC